MYAFKNLLNWYKFQLFQLLYWSVLPEAKRVINNSYLTKKEYLISRDKMNHILGSDTQRSELIHIWGHKRLIWEVCRCGTIIKLIIFNNHERPETPDTWAIKHSPRGEGLNELSKMVFKWNFQSHIQNKQTFHSLTQIRHKISQVSKILLNTYLLRFGTAQQITFRHFTTKEPRPRKVKLFKMTQKDYTEYKWKFWKRETKDSDSQFIFKSRWYTNVEKQSRLQSQSSLGLSHQRLQGRWRHLSSSF